MGEVLPYRPKPDPSQSGARVGMILFLAAWSMMFVSLFFTYAFVRAQADGWPPPGTPRLPLLQPLATTGALVLAAACWFGARRAALRTLQRQAALLLVGAGVLAIAVLLLNFWWVLIGRQLKMSGAYGTLFMTMLFFHSVVALCGVPAPFVLAYRAWKGRVTPYRHIGIRVWAVYWYFVGIVWLALFAVMAAG